MSAILETKTKVETKLNKESFKEDILSKILNREDSLEILKFVFGDDRSCLKLALFEAVKKDKLAEVEYLLSTEIEIPVDVKDEDGNTPLMHACEAGLGNMVQLLLNRGANIYVQNKDNYTPFLRAVYYNKTNIMALLETRDPKIFEKTSLSGRNAFMIAANRNNVELMKLILQKDKEALKRNTLKGDTPLMEAAYTNAIDAARFITENDPDALRSAKDGWTPLMSAAEKGGIEILEMILEKNPTLINQKTENGENALHQAAWAGHYYKINYLLRHGARLKYLSNAGKDEEKFAREKGHTKIADYLKESALQLEHVKNGNLKEIEEWVANCNTLNMRDQNGDSLLHLALEHNQEEIALFLINQKPAKDWKNDEGETAFQSLLKKKGVEYIVPFFKKRAEKLPESLSEEDRTRAEEALQEELEALIAEAEKNKVKINYEYLALNWDKKYWCKFAKDLSLCKETPETKADFSAKKETLSHLIYNNIVVCKESKESKEQEVDFVLGKGAFDIETLSETDEERYYRLSSAFKYAVEGKVYAEAIRLSIEMLSRGATLPDVMTASKDSDKIASKDDLLLKLMEIHYQRKEKEKEIEDGKELAKAVGILDPDSLAG